MSCTAHGAVEVYGHFDMVSGQRVSTLNTVTALMSKGICVRRHSVRRKEIGFDVWNDRASANAFHINPPEFLAFLAWRHENPEFEERMNVCIPYWELPRLPDFWIPVINGMDVILAPTNFVADAVRTSVPDAQVMLHPQAVDIPGDVAPNRAMLGLPADAFVFGTSFGAEAVLERKNPWATIRAFQEAFPTDPDVRLVVRASPGQTKRAVAVWALLREFAGDDERIIIPEGHWSYSQVLSLYASLDVYVSLHRAEGLGLGMMESMALGTPVIATGWSGNMDFMDEENSMIVAYDMVPVEVSDSSPYSASSTGAAGEWAEARLDDAVEKMRLLRETDGLAAELGERAKRDTLERIAWVRKAEFVDELQMRLDDFDPESPEHLAKAAQLRVIERRQGRKLPYYEARRLGGAVLRALRLR